MEEEEEERSLEVWWSLTDEEMTMGFCEENSVIVFESKMYIQQMRMEMKRPRRNFEMQILQ